MTLSLERMNNIKNFSAVNQSVEVEAGVILESIHEFVDEEIFYILYQWHRRGHVV